MPINIGLIRENAPEGTLGALNILTLPLVFNTQWYGLAGPVLRGAI